MEKKTHIVVSSFAALSILRPTTISGIALTMSCSILGGLIPDVDLKDSDIDKLFDKLMTILSSVVISCIVMDYVFSLGLYDKLRDLNGVVNYIVSVGLFIVISFLASKTPHRSYSHSILGILIFTYILSIGFDSRVVLPFFIGIVSHVFIDFFNKTGIEIFYPFQNRLSLKFFESSGFMNKFLFFLCLFLNVLCVGILVFI